MATDDALDVTTPEGRREAQEKIDMLSRGLTYSRLDVCAIATAALKRAEVMEQANAELRRQRDAAYAEQGAERRDPQGGLSEDSERFLADIETRPSRSTEYAGRIVPLTASERDALCAVVRRLSAPASSAVLNEEQGGDVNGAMWDHSFCHNDERAITCEKREHRLAALVRRQVAASTASLTENERLRVRQFRDVADTAHTEGRRASMHHRELRWLCDTIERLSSPSRSEQPSEGGISEALAAEGLPKMWLQATERLMADDGLADAWYRATLPTAVRLLKRLAVPPSAPAPTTLGEGSSKLVVGLDDNTRAWVQQLRETYRTRGGTLTEYHDGDVVRLCDLVLGDKGRD